ILTVILLVIFTASFILAIMETIQSEYSNFSIPPGVNHSGKLQIILASMISISAMGKILEKMRVCSQIVFARYLLSGRKLRPEPRLSLWDARFGRVPVRVYRPRAPSAGLRAAAIFFHGGGWRYCTIDTYEKVCRYIARESDSLVVSVGYRLAPEHPYPAAYEDCLNATIHFMKNIEHYGVDPANVTVCGDSAGGNLAAAVSQTLAGRSDLPKLRAQLPESFILTCEYDVLRDDGLLYKKRLEDNGVRVTWYHLEDGFHGIISLYDFYGFSFPAGKRGLDRIVKFIKDL
ncbi:ADCL4 protein, partial [Chordeiles acutipennis]|nr:ADCL4 protein [Chordeiles acutipennis]